MTDLGFYIDDHALLFAWLARAVMQKEPENGLGLIENWVCSYGRERGARSARRCINDGLRLSVANYFVYSEWNDERGWNRNRVISAAPYFFHTTKCGWNKSWKEHGILEYGQLYCRWVDHALVEGFNPELRLEMTSTLSGGAEQCGFLWPEQAFTDEELQEMAALRAVLIPKVTRNFLYHLAHLYGALRRVIISRLGVKSWQAVMNTGLGDYGKAFGQDKVKALLKVSQQSFFML